MIHALSSLSTGALDVLAQALDDGALRLPCVAGAVQHLVPDGGAVDVAQALNLLAGDGSGSTAAAVLRLLVADRDRAAGRAAQVDLVWSGPETPGSLNRDTSAVVRELLQRARRSVLIATYALDSGDRAGAIFGPLAKRLDRGDPLDVQLFVNVHPPRDPTFPSDRTVADFATRFRDQIWPGRRLPRVYYDPRSLDTTSVVRASLHAKCVVIDEAVAFVTSANFTEAAHHRNVEVGLVAEGAAVARSLVAQFADLVRAGVLVGTAS